MEIDDHRIQWRRRGMSGSPDRELNAVRRPQRGQRLDRRGGDRLRYNAALARIYCGRWRFNDRIAARAGLCNQSRRGLAIARGGLAVLGLAATGLFARTAASLAATALAAAIYARALSQEATGRSPAIRLAVPVGTYTSRLRQRSQEKRRQQHQRENPLAVGTHQLFGPAEHELTA